MRNDIQRTRYYLSRFALKEESD